MNKKVSTAETSQAKFEKENSKLAMNINKLETDITNLSYNKNNTTAAASDAQTGEAKVSQKASSQADEIAKLRQQAEALRQQQTTLSEENTKVQIEAETATKTHETAQQEYTTEKGVDSKECDKLKSDNKNDIAKFKDFAAHQTVAGKAAEGVSKLWNNGLGEKIGISTGHTKSQINSAIKDANSTINKYDSDIGKIDKNFDSVFSTRNKMESKIKDLTQKISGYIDANKKGADIIKTGAAIGAGAVATVATGGMGLVAGAAIGAVAGAGVNAAFNIDEKYHDDNHFSLKDAKDVGIGFAKDSTVGALANLASGGVGKLAGKTMDILGKKLAAKGMGELFTKVSAQMQTKLMQHIMELAKNGRDASVESLVSWAESNIEGLVTGNSNNGSLGSAIASGTTSKSLAYGAAKTFIRH